MYYIKANGGRWMYNKMKRLLLIFFILIALSNTLSAQNFVPKKQKFSGWIAQIIQHEIDHCNGILI